MLVTKPSELAFYPVPKLFLKRIGGHEKWGAIHSAEIGDGTREWEDVPHTLQMLDMFLNEDGDGIEGFTDGGRQTPTYRTGYLEQTCSFGEIGLPDLAPL